MRVFLFVFFLFFLWKKHFKNLKLSQKTKRKKATHNSSNFVSYTQLLIGKHKTNPLAHIHIEIGKFTVPIYDDFIWFSFFFRVLCKRIRETDGIARKPNSIEKKVVFFLLFVPYFIFRHMFMYLRELCVLLVCAFLSFCEIKWKRKQFRFFVFACVLYFFGSLVRCAFFALLPYYHVLYT